MGYGEKYAEVLPKASHFIALGKTNIYLDHDDPDLPWSKATGIDKSGGCRLNGPSGCYIIAEDGGLKFKWSVDFEDRDASGRSTHLFDRPRLREVMRKLPPKVRQKFAEYLEFAVLPAVQQVTSDWREYLNKQLDSEDCLRGLIAFAKEPH